MLWTILAAVNNKEQYNSGGTGLNLYQWKCCVVSNTLCRSSLMCWYSFVPTLHYNYQGHLSRIGISKWSMCFWTEINVRYFTLTKEIYKFTFQALLQCYCTVLAAYHEHSLTVLLLVNTFLRLSFTITLLTQLARYHNTSNSFEFFHDKPHPSVLQFLCI